MMMSRSPIKCHMCRAKVQGSPRKRPRCKECAARAKNVPDSAILLLPCSGCGVTGSWLMEEHNGLPICTNCHRSLHGAASAGSRRWERQCQIDVLKSVTRCVVCSENYPDKLLFVTENLERIRFSLDLSRRALTQRLNGAVVYCWNCWLTKRRDNA